MAAIGIQCKRLVTPLEKFLYDSRCFVQLALRIEKPNFIPEIVEKIKKHAIGFHLGTDGKYLYPTSSDITVQNLPSNISSLEEASDYIAFNYKPKENESLASIAVNDSIIAFNGHHIACDGGYLVHMVKRIQEPDIDSPPLMPIPPEWMFKDTLDNLKDNMDFVSYDKTVTRLTPKKINHVKKGEFIHAKSFTIPTNSLQIFNKEFNQCHHLSEALWTSIIIAATAYNGKIGDNFGCANLVNLRQFMHPSLVDWSITNSWSSLTPSIKANPDLTINEVMKQLRKSYEAKKAEGEMFSYLKTIPHTKGLGLPDIAVEVSNVGPFHIRRPIVDVWTHHQLYANTSLSLVSLLSFSSVGEGHDNLSVRMKYEPRALSDFDALKISQSVKHIIQNVDFDRKIGSVIEEVRNIQK